MDLWLISFFSDVLRKRTLFWGVWQSSTGWLSSILALVWEVTTISGINFQGSLVYYVSGVYASLILAIFVGRTRVQKFQDVVIGCLRRTGFGYGCIWLEHAVITLIDIVTSLVVFLHEQKVWECQMLAFLLIPPPTWNLLFIQLHQQYFNETIFEETCFCNSIISLYRMPSPTNFPCMRSKLHGDGLLLVTASATVSRGQNMPPKKAVEAVATFVDIVSILVRNREKTPRF
ncbi:hypothetical protein OPV22_004257 [Ensete ventricosum]|uniref:Transmembrane protein n=1 Tax=Ensete ventricosum TaxID=4639 RepID=A0AAV8S329_ENSVE|nr:hypothetical protein OPV22_004257 [Ensete ventricosum]